MKKSEFLAILKEALEQELSPQDVAGHLAYYDDYISSQMEGGKPEESVLQELGEPRMIARSILDAADAAKGGYRWADQVFSEAEERRDDRGEEDKEREEGRAGFTFYRNGKYYHFPAWLPGIVAIFLLILVLLVVFAILRGIVVLLLPVLFPLLLILLLIKLLRK